MTAQTAQTSIHAEIVVEAPRERAFHVFLDRFDQIKPRDHTLLPVEIAESVFEPRAGGRVYDRAVDGSECQWGRVIAYEPPARVVFTWEISPRWELEHDPDHASEVEIRFIGESPDRTRVELEHRNLDHHGTDWQALREGVSGDRGWPLYLARYADQVTQRH
jgi:uncharacterized protein YndB with AHSA1/START domain